MRSKFFIAFIAGMAMLLTACNDENDSTLDINTIQGRATVEGKVSYNSGDAFDAQGNVVYDDQYTVAAGKTVYFYMQLSSLGSYEGNLVYTTTTNADGSFSIELPANNNGINYTISVESFKTTRNEYNSTSNTLVPKNYFFTNTEVATVEVFENIGEYREIKLEEENYTKID